VTLALADGCLVGCPLTDRGVGRDIRFGRCSWSAEQAGGALGGTRTPNLLIRSQMLSPIELRAPVAEMRAYLAPGSRPNR
jgi:hypothetical protein